jgi:hypothetical protein
LPFGHFQGERAVCGTGNPITVRFEELLEALGLRGGVFRNVYPRAAVHGTFDGHGSMPPRDRGDAANIAPAPGYKRDKQ